MMLFEYS